MSDRKKTLLHLIYDLPEYRKVLPPLPDKQADSKIRRHQRFSVKCPAQLLGQSGEKAIPIEISEVSRYGFRARTSRKVPGEVWLTAVIQLGAQEISRLTVQVVQGTDQDDKHYSGFRIGEPDLVWRKFVTALYQGHTHSDLDQATRFLS